MAYMDCMTFTSFATKWNRLRNLSDCVGCQTVPLRDESDGAPAPAGKACCRPVQVKRSTGARYAACSTPLRSASLTSTISRIKRRVRSANASLSPRQLSNSTPTP